MKFGKLLFAAIAFCMAAVAGTASAAPVVSYGNAGAFSPIYFGSGNSDGQWAIGTDNNVSAMLRFKNRATLGLIDSADGTAEIGQGYCNPTCTGSPKAKWNYEFLINTRADGTGTRGLTNTFVDLLVDTDPTVGTSFSVINLFANWGDNEYYNGVKRIGVAPVFGEYMVEQSSNPLFADSGFGFLPGPGLYSFQLNVYNAVLDDKKERIVRGKLLTSVGNKIQVVPEPSSMALIAHGFAGMMLTRRRQTNDGVMNMAATA